MKIQWLGHSCFTITLLDGRIILTDPHENIGYPSLNTRADIITVSHQHSDHNAVKAVAGSPEVVEDAGIHELGEVKITGIPSYHDGKKGGQRGPNLIFLIEAEGLRVCHLGDLGHELDGVLVEKIGPVDVLMVPIGGFYTIDSEQAAKVVDRIGPNYILPMHYKTDYITFPISEPDQFLSGYSGYLKKTELEVSRDSLPTAPQAVLLSIKE